MHKWSILSGRFGALTGRLGDLMKKLETLGKTGRVGRYAPGKQPYIYLLKPSIIRSWLHYRVHLSIRPIFFGPLVTILMGFLCDELTFSSHSVITRAQITASQWTMFGQDDHLSGQTFSWPAVIIDSGQVYGFQINDWEKRSIHINSVNHNDR